MREPAFTEGEVCVQCFIQSILILIITLVEKVFSSLTCDR